MQLQAEKALVVCNFVGFLGCLTLINLVFDIEGHAVILPGDHGAVDQGFVAPADGGLVDKGQVDDV